MRTKNWLVLTVQLLVVSWFGTDVSADDFAALRRKIESELRERQIPSLAVGVARDGEIVWEQGFGWANREQRKKATEHTLYSLASISKPITATGIMVLVQDDKISLDRRANAYLPRTKLTAHVGKAEEATVRKLANHTSGLPLHYQFFYEDEPFRRPPMDESISRYGHLVVKPGTHYQYANFGYGVLDYIIAQRSGKAYAAFMKERVFLPLGMTRSSVYIDPTLRPFAAVRYAPDQTPLPLYEFDHPGASAVYSSAHDLLRFGMFHIGTPLKDQKAILRDGYVKEMQKPTAKIGAKSGYGVGWRIDDDVLGYKLVSHTGGMPGVSTRLTLVPDQRIVVTALCNKSDRLPHTIVSDILDVLLPERVKARQKGTSTNGSPKPKDVVEPGYYEGNIHTYKGDRRLRMWVPKKPSKWIHVQVDNQLRTLLNERSFRDGILRGTFQSDIGTPDANRRPYVLRAKLFVKKGALSGSITVHHRAHSQKGSNAISHWCELKRVSDLVEPISIFDGTSMKDWEVANKNDFKRHGKVQLKDESIVMNAGEPATGVRYKGNFPTNNYQVTFEARRLDGSDFFCGVTFPVGKSHCTMICGGWGGGVTGLSNIDNMAAVENQTTYHVDYKQGRWYRIRVQVTDDVIRTWVDDQMTADVKRKDRKFSIWWEQEPMRDFGIACWRTKAAVRNIVVSHP